MAEETIMASVTLKSKSGLSIFKNLDKFSLRTVDNFRPIRENVSKVAQKLVEAGFKVEAQTQVGISFSGPKRLFESEFATKIRRQKIARKVPLVGKTALSFSKQAKTL